MRVMIARGLVAVVFSSATMLVALPSVASAEACANAEFRVGPSASLPDCRAYEQVTPVEKQGGLFKAELMGPGPDGTPDLNLYSAGASIAGLQANEYIGGTYSTVRSSSGWVTSALPPPASEYQTAVGVISYPVVGMSLDARSGLWPERRRSWPMNRADLFLTRPGAPIEDVGTLTPPGTPTVPNAYEILQDGEIGVVGWSDDLSHILYRQNRRFWPFDATENGNQSLYELVGTGNTQPMLVGLGSDGKLISDCGTELGGGHETPNSGHNAVSANGSIVFFTAIECGSSPPMGALFARVDNGGADARTVAISEPTLTDCEACDTEPAVRKPGAFEGASVDGSKVFFLTEQPLLGGDSTRNIYEYDFSAPAGERIVRVSGGDSSGPSHGAEVEGTVETSEDGSHVYFVAHGALTAAPNGQGQVARQGADNLYAFERDARYPAGHTAFIAALSQSDESLWRRGEGADVTEDGRFLVFTSTTDHLTADDTSTAAQVFEYDAQTASLVRVSIGQDGYNDNGNTSLAGASIVSPGYNGQSAPTAYWSKLSVSADGSVFFQSGNGLTPQALNRKVLAQKCTSPFPAFCQPPLFEEFQTVLEESGYIVKFYANNIYEYHNGNVYLISDGRDVSLAPSDESDVRLVGTDASGADVLFTTVDSLTPQDTDTNIDIYDARVDGGFPAPAPLRQCTADDCQGALSPAPTLLSPGSEFQAGGGDVALPAARPALMHKLATKKAKKKVKKKTTRKKGRKAHKARRNDRSIHVHGKRGQS